MWKKGDYTQGNYVKDNYRRCFIDMQLGAVDEGILAKADAKELIRIVKGTGATAVTVKARTWQGWAYYPTKYGEMHPTLAKRGYNLTKEMLEEAKKAGLKRKVYFSFVVDNHAYEHHPEWRCKNQQGMESYDLPMYVAPDYSSSQKNRYGYVCFSNEDYMTYALGALQEILESFEFESIFIDMPYWMYPCYCDSCKVKFKKITGRDMPKKADWDDPEFRAWQLLREKLDGELGRRATELIKKYKPECTVEYNQAFVYMNWTGGWSEYLNEYADYVSGDIYDGFFEQSFYCKYFRNISNVLPFNYITGRCKILNLHTTTKAANELSRQAMLALVHDGAFDICDGIDPDGTLCEEVYANQIRECFDTTKPYEEYAGGELLTDAAIWFPSHSRFDRNENGKPVAQAAAKFGNSNKYQKHKMDAGRRLREADILYDVISSKNLKDLDSSLLIITSVASILDDEMADIEAYLNRGGTVYLTGRPGHPRLLELLEAENGGEGEYANTYMEPTKEGRLYFCEFNHQKPMFATRQTILNFREGSDYTVLATTVLPGSKADINQSVSMHSNPPWIYTDVPCCVLKQVGKGQIFWVGTEIESSGFPEGRSAVHRIFRSFVKDPVFVSAEAPWPVELISWKKDGRQYVAAINEMDDQMPFDMTGVQVTLPYEAKSVRLLNGNGAEAKADVSGGKTFVEFPPFSTFAVAEIVP